MVVLEKEEILERGHQLLKVKKQVFEFQCKLCRPGVPEEILVEAKNYIKPAHVDGVVEERSQHNLCGNIIFNLCINLWGMKFCIGDYEVLYIGRKFFSYMDYICFFLSS